MRLFGHRISVPVKGKPKQKNPPCLGSQAGGTNGIYVDGQVALICRSLVSR